MSNTPTRRRSRRSLPESLKDEHSSADRKRRNTQCLTNCIVCPVCTITVRGDNNFEQHYKHELEKMKEPFISIDAKKKHYQMKLRSQRQSEDQEGEVEPMKSLQERTDDLSSIRKRRYERYTDMYLVSMKRKKALACNNNQTIHTENEQNVTENSTYELITCAVCNEFLETTNCKRHLSKCFAKHDYHFDLYSSSEEESDNEEEGVDDGAPQSWAYMDSDYLRREGQLTRLVVEDGDEELDIDGDTDTQFGGQQFSERDIIPCSSEKTNAELASDEILRQAVNVTSFAPNHTSSHNTKGLLVTDSKRSGGQQSSTITYQHGKLRTLIDKSDNDKDKLLDSLKLYINKIEDKYEKEILKCPICMGPYNEPAVSISCWHTCCSDCWLRVLGTKKLCPKCNNIVSPSQLRKIFL